MIIFECAKCDWKGERGEVATILASEFLGKEQDEMNEEDNEIIEVCPQCEPYQIAYINKL